MPLWLQLYVSVDAATKESLKAVDRPLFSDFWERFLVGLQKYLQMHIMKLWFTNTNYIGLFYLL
jgi:wyosine [tRNA(Phe)-imidazoG37] synthetase (radical SAM superfamily)